MRDGINLVTTIKDKIYLKLANETKIISTDMNFSIRPDVLHLYDDIKIVANNRDGEFIGIYHGDLQGEAVRLIDLNQTKTQVLVEVNFGSQNVANINEITRLKHNFNVSVADGYNISVIFVNILQTTMRTQSVNRILSLPQQMLMETSKVLMCGIMFIEYCTGNKNGNKHMHVSRWCIIHIDENISRFLDNLNWYCVYLCLFIHL